MHNTSLHRTACQRLSLRATGKPPLNSALGLIHRILMPKETDEKFYDRADAHIHLSNDHLKDIGRGKVSASMMYATARFNAWVSACGFRSGEHIANAREETIEYFVQQYRLMLEENLDDYIQNFEEYIQAADPKS
jgi:hypothetical protein